MKDNDPWLAYLESLHPKNIDLGLDRIERVGQQQALFDLGCKVILVAGTNGKGSTIKALEALLLKAGLRVGCYTSPHILSFNERIQINGKPIDDDTLRMAFETIEKLRQDVSLTYFEFTTLAAFSIFKQAPIDVLLAEIGLGGRLDAVNTLTPDLSVITSIGHDHHEWLGDTLEEIGYEKAGILRSNTPCILSKQALVSSVLETAQDLNCNAVIEGKDFDWGLDLNQNKNHKWCFGGDEFTVPVNNLPDNSISVALAAYQTLKNDAMPQLPPISEVQEALLNLSLFGRYQCIQQNPTIILDVAHNEDSCLLLKSRLEQLPRKGRLLAVWGMLEDKDIARVVALFKDTFDAWFVPQLQSQRACKTSKLVEMLSASKIDEIFELSSTKLAYKALLDFAEDTDQIIVFGSFFTVSEFLTAYQQEQMTMQCLN